MNHFRFDNEDFLYFTRHIFRSSTCCLVKKINAGKWEKSFILKG